jgi:hypothetical protein
MEGEGSLLLGQEQKRNLWKKKEKNFPPQLSKKKSYRPVPIERFFISVFLAKKRAS